MIISGYFYHLWTEEKWANYPREEFGGKSYQKYLNSLNQEEGILAEMKRAASTDIKDMVNWNYNNPNFLEIKYEDIIKDEQKVFYNLFKHYGFRKDAIQAALKIAEQYSFKNVAKRKVGQKQQKSHLRSGKPGEWRDFFTEKHKNSFKELLGDVVVKLGYEVNNNW